MTRTGGALTADRATAVKATLTANRSAAPCESGTPGESTSTDTAMIVDPAAAAVYATRATGSSVTVGTLRSWVNREHITRHNGGYSLAEIDAWLTRRNPSKARRPASA